MQYKKLFVTATSYNFPQTCDAKKLQLLKPKFGSHWSLLSRME